MTSEGVAEHTEQAARRRLDGLWWAVALMWAGVVFVAENVGVLPQVRGADAWSWIFLGAGLLALLMNTYRAVGINLPRPRTWDWIWTGALILLGFGGFTNIDYAWPAILILAGLLFLIRSLRGSE